MGNLSEKKIVNLSIDGNIATLQIDDGRINLIGSDTLIALRHSISEVEKADAVILCGRRRIFSAGLNLVEMEKFDKNELLDFFDSLHELRSSLFALPRPLITATAGSAIGAGASLICCGDIRISANDTGKVGFTEAQLALPLPASARLIATSTLKGSDALSSLILGCTYNKEEAEKLGYFHKLVESKLLLSNAEESAKSAAAVSQGASMIKATLRQAALNEMEADKKRSHEEMVEAWFTDEAQLRIEKVIETIRSKKST